MSRNTSFDSDKWPLWETLERIQREEIQLPDFQRDWVWDDERIRSLLASVSRGYPIGTLMLLMGGNPDVRFKNRALQGAPVTSSDPEWLLLDGQQRMTSLYNVLKSGNAVETRDARKRPLTLWYYLDIRKAIDPYVDRDEAIVAVPEDKKRRSLHDIILDVSTRELEYQQWMFPLTLILDRGDLREWLRGFEDFLRAQGNTDVRPVTDEVEEILRTFESYLIPVIVLGKNTPKDAVCQVFEKVNTGGVTLNVFELVTATYAADGFDLRQDWSERSRALYGLHPVLHKLENTDFLQAVTLLSTWHRWNTHHSADGTERGFAVGCKRKDVLALELDEYTSFAELAQQGFDKAARFLTAEHIYSSQDLPYRTQVVPLAVLLSILGRDGESDGVRRRLRSWFWCGVFGEMYGSATETRFANDVREVLQWTNGGAEPSTIRDASFAADRLYTMRSRNSAAYKGLYALLMRDGARDFRTGESMTLMTHYAESVDIHHIFPQRWCQVSKIDKKVYDSIVNKTALSASTNREIGGRSPSEYLQRLQERHEISEADLDVIITSHLVEPKLVRSDDFGGFFNARFSRLIDHIERAMGKEVTGKEQVTAAVDEAANHESFEELDRDATFDEPLSAAMLEETTENNNAQTRGTLLSDPL